MFTYESYKDSGVHYLGDIPLGWKVTKIKHAANINPSNHITFSEFSDHACFLPMEAVLASGEVDYSSKRLVKDVKSGFTSFKKDDVLLAKITPCFENGKGAYLNEMPTKYGFGSTEFHVIRANKHYVPHFLYYLTKTHMFMDFGEQMMTGSAGQKRVPTAFLENFEFASPSYEEQLNIVSFLTVNIELVDEAIAIKQKQIELLKERKQIIIQQAVTQGLNPDVPMKDSGVDWIGEIPEHWGIVRFKNLFTQSRLPVRKGDGVVTSYRDGQVTLRSNRRVGGYTEAILEGGYQGIRKGQLVLNSMDAFEGAIGVSDSDGKCTPEYVICDPINRVDVSQYYFAYLLREMALAKYIQVICNAVRQRAVRIRYNNLAPLFMVVPPVKEQENIVSFIEKESAKLDAGIKHLNEQISKLKEYKATLINSAVTGKIKVTELA
ncbi:restriction endonuclease subunit S [Vibrio parahaemolyticus]|nr:restriction endonuclease subunit S [Vibrio parahaemolyticus]